MSEVRKGRAEIAQREWVEFDVAVNSKSQIESIHYRVRGCHHLMESARIASLSFDSKNLSELRWPGVQHWDLLISEAFDRAKGEFKIPVEDPETCHCRKIPTAKVDEAIVMGAHTPELVTAWTTASSGCGTCRPVVERIISYRLKKAVGG